MDKFEKQRLKELWDDKHEQQLERILSKNEELRKVFEEHPDRKDLYRLKILDSEIKEAPSPPLKICCETCAFQLPPAPVGGVLTSRHTWGSCLILDNKPHEVLYDGARCEFYEKQK